MYRTQFGAFNGRSWEDLCQQVFKKKHGADGYQAMPASPGDFGIEGYTAHTGLGFQCYCPEKHCTSKELYENQRDKITADLGKLRTNEGQLAKRLGDTKIREWIFVSPVVDKHELLRHAKAKEAEVRSWGLSIVAPNFIVLLRDGDFYAQEIKSIQTMNGEPLTFDTTPPTLQDLSSDMSEYERNINRKSRLRVAGSDNAESRARRLAESTRNSFLECTPFLREIERSAPTVYFQLLRLVTEFEHQLLETCTTWHGTPEELTSKLRTELTDRIAADLNTRLDGTTAARVARHLIARWLAVCQLDFD